MLRVESLFTENTFKYIEVYIKYVVIRCGQKFSK